MSETMLFSRARLRKDAPIQALVRVLVPDGAAERAATAHPLVWTLFADSPERKRDFLWREAEPGVFYFLSNRLPVDHHRLFDLDPPKPFAPALAVGDRLAFSLRANATVARGGGAGRRGKPCDVVMAALYDLPAGARAEQRADKTQEAGVKWLENQGAKSGFTLARRSDGTANARSVSHTVLTLDRRNAAMRIGVLDLEGVLVVSDPALFCRCLAHGFGRAKAFGCGLMLIRRA
jgi:CRISPR system Cascade subunit CasE